MEFPVDWTVLPKENFNLAIPRIEGLLTMELLAELRPSGGKDLGLSKPAIFPV
jgi:hypothetical protein